MTEQRWEQLVQMIEDSFQVIDHKRRDWDSEHTEKSESIIFVGPIGKMKMERVWRPLVIDRKTVGSKRSGSATHEELIYSDTETTAHTAIYRYNAEGDSWDEISLENLGL